MIEWLSDDRGNRCSVQYFGTREAAQAALDSLTDCDDCINCSRCSGCSRCSRCSRCSDCSRCSGCLDCSGLYLRRGTAAVKLGEASHSPPMIPVIPNIHSMVYAAASNPKALNMSDWHTCENTHCRAGWVVTLAGEAGADLEKFYNTALAAMMIYDASDPAFKINPGRFFDDNETALADMKALAEARAIAALLPEPVDPDLLIARQIVADAYAEAGGSDVTVRKTRSGEDDDSWDVRATLTGIRRGRELENKETSQ